MSHDNMNLLHQRDHIEHRREYQAVLVKLMASLHHGDNPKHKLQTL